MRIAPGTSREADRCPSGEDGQHAGAEGLPQDRDPRGLRPDTVSPGVTDGPTSAGLRPMKIAVVANTAWYVYNFRRNLMLHLQAMGHEVHALAPRDRYADLLMQDGMKHHDVVFHGAGTNPLKEMETVRRLRRVFRQQGVDAVLSYTPKGNIYSAFALTGIDSRLIVNVSGLGRAFASNRFLPHLVQRLYRQAFKRAEWVFFQNEYDRSVFIEKELIDAGKTSRLPGSGVDLARFSMANTTVERYPGTVFLFVARLLWDKGIGDYVAAARLVMSRYPDVRFRVLGSVEKPGDGAVPMAALQAWINEGVIEYLGSTDDVRPHLAAADCVILPSFYREGVPRSLLEAAAMSRPVITTDAVGCRDTVEDQVTGFLSRARDSVDLADKICRFISCPAAEKERMGSMARKKMERDFDEKIVIHAYSTLLHTRSSQPARSALMPGVPESPV